jgi:hypothetical protein
MCKTFSTIFQIFLNFIRYSVTAKKSGITPLWVYLYSVYGK